MKTWIVARPEVYISYHRVEAVTEQEAIDLLHDGEVDNEIDLEYSRTLDRDSFWADEQDDYDAPETGKILERAKFVETRPIRPGVFPKWTEV